MSQTSTAPQQAPAVQGAHHYVLTLQHAARGGYGVFTTSGTLTPPAGWTRNDIFQGLIAETARTKPELADANVLFFDLQPNQL
ncbi:hypothetical protein [Kitasatospora cineracea]|uniref:hypothetical protein n=1 Tax=Kitasatospora cineracea TaxID=88074 RepID=UPI0033DF13A0